MYQYTLKICQLFNLLFRFQEPPMTTPSSNAITFKDCWLYDSSPYKSWLAKSAFDTVAYCKLCKTNFFIGNTGVTDLKRHAESKMHNFFLHGRAETNAAVHMLQASLQAADSSAGVLAAIPSTSSAIIVNYSVRVMQPQVQQQLLEKLLDIWEV